MQLIWLVLATALSMLSGAAVVLCSIHSPLSLTQDQKDWGLFISVMVLLVIIGRVPDPYGLVVIFVWLVATFIAERVLLPGPENAQRRFYR